MATPPVTVKEVVSVRATERAGTLNFQMGSIMRSRVRLPDD
jgi:hypothetical protein